MKRRKHRVLDESLIGFMQYLAFEPRTAIVTYPMSQNHVTLYFSTLPKVADNPPGHPHLTLSRTRLAKEIIYYRVPSATFLQTPHISALQNLHNHHRIPSHLLTSSFLLFVCRCRPQRSRSRSEVVLRDGVVQEARPTGDGGCRASKRTKSP